MGQRTTQDGLPVVTEETFMEFLREYDIATNDPEVTRRIRTENPQISRILKIGMQQAPSREARAYFECGMQIVYELLRRQKSKDRQS